MRDTLDPPPKPEGGSPQWPLVRKGLERYMAAGRVAGVAFDYLEKRMSLSTSASKEANESAVRRMLTWFFSQDAGEPDPLAWMPPASPVAVGVHTLTLAPSAIYATPGGYIVRQLWTTDGFSIDRPYSAVVAAAYLLSAEAALGVSSVRRLDFWHLRKRRQRSWRPSALAYSLAQLGTLLDRVAARIGNTDDPAAA